jgi:hypothetical protein
MNRKIITREKLAAWMTDGLRKIDGCNECSVGLVNLLQEPDAEGCNWSSDLTVNSAGVPLQYFRPYLEKILTQARAEYNVE